MHITSIASDIRGYKQTLDRDRFDTYNNINRLAVSKLMQKYKEEIDASVLFDYFANTQYKTIDSDSIKAKFIENHIAELKQYDIKELIKPYIEEAKIPLNNYFKQIIANQPSQAKPHKINSDTIKHKLNELCDVGICNSWLYNISVIEGIEMEKDMVATVKTIMDNKMVITGVVFRNILDRYDYSGKNVIIKDLLERHSEKFKQFTVKKMLVS